MLRLYQGMLGTLCLPLADDGLGARQCLTGCVQLLTLLLNPGCRPDESALDIIEAHPTLLKGHLKGQLGRVEVRSASIDRRRGRRKVC